MVGINGQSCINQGAGSVIERNEAICAPEFIINDAADRSMPANSCYL
jgi:hypothetical protein